ncbi:hypothetical protein P1X16_30240 [Hymenobacter sp. YC55]|nr:hypothetical protein [Hymenobacter sp. YC55]
MILCEACRLRASVIQEKRNGSVIPYCLCQPCYQRLLHRALRPLEYFNLVALHGHEYELCDDFYSDDGVADAAEEPVDLEPALTFPTLESLRGHVERLVDYTIVKWWYPAAVTPYLVGFAPQEVLHVLDDKLARNPFLLPRCLEVAAEVLQGHAYAWVKYQLSSVEEPLQVLDFAYALSRCFPAAEAEAVLLAALSTLNEKALAEHVTCLCYLAGNGPLDWIEAHCRAITTVPGGYGVTCAALGITWERVQRWLKMGRPLSLMALDALVNCSTTAATQNRPLWLREHPPYLHAPSTLEAMNEVLSAYVTLDSVPRTKMAIRFIQEHWPQILKTN